MSVPRARDRRSVRRQPPRLRVVRLPVTGADSASAADLGEAATSAAVAGTAAAVDSADTVESVGAGQADSEVDGAAAAAEGGVAAVPAKPRRWRPVTIVLALALVGALVAAGV
ncbi:MAG TPA: hypothetical protein VFX61_11055, partial [Micromonosporaceae bacterium]|nr:hypothetical protein [Micromonosporaceae bacterium]